MRPTKPPRSPSRTVRKPRPKPPAEYHGVIVRAVHVDPRERERAANAVIDWLTKGDER